LPSFFRLIILSVAVRFIKLVCGKDICVFLKVKISRNRLEGPEEGGRGIVLLFLDLGARRGWVVSTTPRPLYPRERPGTHCTGDWMGPKAGLDVCEKSRPPPGFDPRTVQPVASRYTDWAIPALCVFLPNGNWIKSNDEFCTLCRIVCLEQVHCEVLQTSCVLKIPVPLFLALLWSPCGVTPSVLVDSYLRCRESCLPNCTLSRQRVFSMPNAMRTSTVIQCYSLSCLPQNKRSLL
jgi:hypothetical protein